MLVGGGPGGGRAHGDGGRDQALQRVILVGHLFPVHRAGDDLSIIGRRGEFVLHGHTGALDGG